MFEIRTLCTFLAIRQIHNAYRNDFIVDAKKNEKQKKEEIGKEKRGWRGMMRILKD